VSPAHITASFELKLEKVSEPGWPGSSLKLGRAFVLHYLSAMGTDNLVFSKKITSFSEMQMIT
jgi:hypothetical protein